MAWSRSKYRLSVRKALFLVLFGGACLGLFIRQVKLTREDAKRRGDAGVCSANLAIIGIALHQYHNDYGCFPPAYIADANGKPMHSWRVLVLASADYPSRSIFDAYNFNEPWDGPNNRMLAAKMGILYAVPPITTVTEPH
jgi:hypothetical protein